MKPYAMARRSFLRAAGASAGLCTLLRSIESAAAGLAPPQRVLFLHRPVGTIRTGWLPKGTPAAFTLSSIMAPFEPVRGNMVVLDGLAVKASGAQAGPHETGMTTIMTGGPVASGGGSNDAPASGPSIDQILHTRSPVLGGTAIASLQLGAADRLQFIQLANRTASWSGRATRMPPELSPLKVYQRVFGAMVPTTNKDLALRTRVRKGSVLDFIRRDLARLRAMSPAAERAKLDAHASAILELEHTFDMSPAAAACAGLTAPPNLPTDTDKDYPMVGKLNLANIRAAFACDLTRVATFMWAPCTSSVGFEGLYSGMPLTQHHPASHMGGTDQQVGAIDTWYSGRTAEFIASLRDIPEGAGTLLDNTLVVYFSEVSYGGNHDLTNLPFLLFGGPGVRLRGNRFLTYAGRSTNDLWLATAPVFGVNMTALGDPSQYTRPLEGIFD